MANPDFPSDGQNERIDALVGPDGTVYLKAALPAFSPTGADDPAASHMVGTHADGATAGATDNLVLIAGRNGTTVKHLVLDSGGRVIVVGQDNVGGVPTVPPLMAAGYDGTNVQYLAVGTDGRLQIVGSIPTASAVAGDPVLMGAQDGTNVRIPKTDANSYWQVVRGGYTDASTFFSSRIANTYKTANGSSSGNNAIWTPTTGKKFRLLRCMLNVTAEVATSGGARIIAQLNDSSTAIGVTFEFWAPTTSVTTGAGDAFNSGWVDLGDAGYLSTTANNVLNLNLSAALSSGKARLIVIGTEE